MSLRSALKLQVQSAPTDLLGAPPPPKAPPPGSLPNPLLLHITAAATHPGPRWLPLCRLVGLPAAGGGSCPSGLPGGQLILCSPHDNAWFDKRALGINFMLDTLLPRCIIVSLLLLLVT